jgi:ribosomal 50S subunit-associated protein YjgA (DUF615 family)
MTIAPMEGRLTLITSEQPETLGKCFSLRDGKLIKETSGHLLRGLYAVQSFQNIEQLRDTLMKVGNDQAITVSLPLETLPQIGQVVSRNLLRQYPGAISRTKEHLNFRAGCPGIMTMYYYPPENAPER